MISALIETARPWLGQAQIVDASLQRWRYAGPVTPWPDPYCMVHQDPLVVLAGDAFAGPKVEGAHNSGRAAAKVILDS